MSAKHAAASDACPYCGGKNGYYYAVRCLDRRQGGWGEGVEADESVEIEAMRVWPKTARCIDCHRRVSIERGAGASARSRTA